MWFSAYTCCFTDPCILSARKKCFSTIWVSPQQWCVPNSCSFCSIKIHGCHLFKSVLFLFLLKIHFFRHETFQEWRHKAWPTQTYCLQWVKFCWRKTLFLPQVFLTNPLPWVCCICATSDPTHHQVAISWQFSSSFPRVSETYVCRSDDVTPKFLIGLGCLNVMCTYEDPFVQRWCSLWTNHD